MPQSREGIDFGGEWTQTRGGEEFLLADSGQSDPNRFVVFATTGNLELCKADTFYIDGTFKSSYISMCVFEFAILTRPKKVETN